MDYWIGNKEMEKSRRKNIGWHTKWYRDKNDDDDEEEKCRISKNEFHSISILQIQLQFSYPFSSSLLFPHPTMMACIFVVVATAAFAGTQFDCTTIPNFEWPVVCYHFLLFVGGIYKLQSRHLDSGCSRCTYLLVVIAEALNGLVIVILVRNENMCNGVAVWVVV